MTTIKPERPYRALRSAIGSLLLLAFSSVWLLKWYNGENIDSMWIMAMLVVLFAAGMAVFGRETFTSAVETAQDVKDPDEE